MHQISPMTWVPVWCYTEHYHCRGEKKKNILMSGSGGHLLSSNLVEKELLIADSTVPVFL